MSFLCQGTKGFHFVDSSGPLLAKDAAPSGSHHNIFLDTDAAKIPVGLEPVVADEVGKFPFSFPPADELWNEVDARLDREDESRLEGAGQPQRFDPEESALRLPFIARPNFT